jgi:AmiR/NasT family two-component response regulator
MANAAALMSAELTNRHLREALESRDLIGQAKGILMARQGISADQAFDLLRHNSQQSGRKLKDLAAEIASGPGSSPRDRR